MERYTEIERNRAIRFLKNMERVLEEKNSDIFCYAIGYCHRSIEGIKSLESENGISVMKCESTREGWRGLLPIAFPNYFILLIENKKVFFVFEKLDWFLNIEYFLLRKKYNDAFLNEIDILQVRKRPESLRKDPSFFIYGVDCDSPSSDTGFMEYVSFGKDAPQDLTALFL